jgi:H+-translocating NAD(P) transhydrogenase subunit beta
MMESVFPVLYILAAAGFILAIKWMNSPATARRGVLVGELGMLLAVVGTLLRAEVVTYQWILIAFFVGSAIGVPIAYYMPMTAVPQRTAFSHACGALAAALIGTAEYYRAKPHGFVMAALMLEIRIPDIHGQHDGVRQAGRKAADPTHHVSRTELR